MAPKVGGVAPFTDPCKDQWVNVTWMPHTALSQTSHICLTVHSAHVVLDDSFSTTSNNVEWRVQIGIYGIANLPLAPIQSYTKSSPVVKRTRDNLPNITIQKATHQCVWDNFLHMPIRWRDLPRDSYFLFEILRNGNIVYHATMPFFNRYGKLSTGLQKLQLQAGPLNNPNRNYGLVATTSEKNMDIDDDPVWKAVLIVDELERMEARNRNNPNLSGRDNDDNTFGRTPSVPWLDAMMKERAKQQINEAFTDTSVRDIL
jgi:Phosphoinositide 3-kinase C2